MKKSKIQKHPIIFEQNLNNNKMCIKFGSKNEFFEKEKTEHIFTNKFLEKADLNDIYKLLNEINKTLILNNNIINKKDGHNIKRSYSFENRKNINRKEHSEEFEEILYILKKPLINKNIKKHKSYFIPFKPLLKPKKISLVGKVIINIPTDDTLRKFSFEENGIKSNNNNLIFNYFSIINKLHFY